MIPKIIHYCWFGKKELPDLESKCLESWKRVLFDYKIMLWNEDNSNFSDCIYAQQAYANNKFAFVSDYVRIKALYEYGGIYLDTDVEVLKKFDHLLHNEAFLGFENRTSVGTAVMACCKGADFAKLMVEYYQTHSFLDKKRGQNLTTNVTILNDILESKGMERINKEQIVDGILILQRDIFFPKKVSENDFLLTPNSLSIHRMKGSWLTDKQRKRGSNKFWINICRPLLRFIQKLLTKTLGNNRSKSIEIKVRNLLK